MGIIDIDVDERVRIVYLNDEQISGIKLLDNLVIYPIAGAGRDTSIPKIYGTALCLYESAGVAAQRGLARRPVVMARLRSRRQANKRNHAHGMRISGRTRRSPRSRVHGFSGKRRLLTMGLSGLRFMLYVGRTYVGRLGLSNVQARSLPVRRGRVGRNPMPVD